MNENNTGDFAFLVFFLLVCFLWSVFVQICFVASSPNFSKLNQTVVQATRQTTQKQRERERVEDRPASSRGRSRARTC